MIDDTIDLLQVKIEKAKSELSPDTTSAISAVDWQAAILGLREKKGYSFEQLSDLELETELFLCGLLNPADYPKELEKRMQISKAEANDLANEMNNLVFKKIKEELIKITERKKTSDNKTIVEPPRETFTAPISNLLHNNTNPTEANENRNEVDILKRAGIEIMPDQITAPSIPAITIFNTQKREEVLKAIEKPEPIIKNEIHPMFKQKMSKPFQIPMVKTEHSLDNLSKTQTPINSPLPEYPLGEGGQMLPPRLSATPEEGNKDKKKMADIKTPVPKAPKDYPKTGDPYRLNPNE